MAKVRDTLVTVPGFLLWPIDAVARLFACLVRGGAGVNLLRRDLPNPCDGASAVTPSFKSSLPRCTRPRAGFFVWQRSNRAYRDQQSCPCLNWTMVHKVQAITRVVCISRPFCWTTVQWTQGIIAWCHISRGGGLGGRDVKSHNCWSDCALRMRSVRNSSLTSLIARWKDVVVRG